MSVSALSQPLHVVSTRVYESGPASPVVKPRQLAVNKQEELTTSRKKEQLITKQIETHVKREILVDQDGNIVETGDPDITTNTTEDVKVDETETNELKTTGGESPGPGWVFVPGSQTVNEKVRRTKTNHVIRDEKTEAEETEGLPALTREEYQRIMDARHLAINGHNSRLPSLPVTETVVETEEVREVSEALGDVLYSTDKSRTSSREKSSSPYPESDKMRRRRDLNQRPRHSPPLPPSPPPVIVNVNKSFSKPSTTTSAKTSAASPGGGVVKQKDTSRWIENHFGETPSPPPGTPTRVTAVLRDAPSPVHVFSDNPGLGVNDDDKSGPNHFSAIKDFFQTAVENTERSYYNGRTNTLSRRERGSKNSGSSSGSNNGRPSSLFGKAAQPASSAEQVRVVNVGRTTHYPSKRAENGTDFPRSLHRQHSYEDANAASTSENNGNYPAHVQRSGYSRDEPDLDGSDQELKVQKIINSLRSSNLKDLPQQQGYSSSTSSRLSPEGKHVIKINVNSGKQSGSLPSPTRNKNGHVPYDSNAERPSSAASYLNDSSPSQKVKLRVNNSSNLKKQNALNRSTPTLYQCSSPPPTPLYIPSSTGRSLSSLALNHIGYSNNNVANTHSLPRNKHRNKSSIWISSNNDIETRRQRFMEGLLDEKDHRNDDDGRPFSPTVIIPSPKPPPRRHHKSNGGSSSGNHRISSAAPHQKTSRSSPQPQPPPLRRPTSPDSRSSSSRSFYYLGEQQDAPPPRSESPVTRTEKTVKRKVTTSKTCINDTDPYPDHYDIRQSPRSPPSRPMSRSRV